MSLQEIVFVVDGKPQGKQRPRLGKGGCVYTPRETKRYERSIAWAATAGRPRGWRLSWAVSVEVACYFPDLHIRDIDNVLKAVLDGMNGVAYNDDSQVALANVTKALDREHPRTEVVVRQAAPWSTEG